MNVNIFPWIAMSAYKRESRVRITANSTAEFKTEPVYHRLPTTNPIASLNPLCSASYRSNPVHFQGLHHHHDR